MSQLTIGIANDHGAVALKKVLVSHVEALGHTVVDFGVATEESVDYPDYAGKAAIAVQNKEVDLGILLCGTGIGMSIAANKYKGIRCALCHDTFSAKVTREHNNSNMLAMGARVIGDELAKVVVTAFLSGKFEGGRHQTRIDKISALES